MGVLVKKLVVLLLVAMLSLSAAAGCSAKAPASSAEASKSQFEEFVTQGDKALEAGDAKAAFDLYTKALAAPDANDTDGEVAKKQAHTKSLFIARNLLVGDANPLDPSDSVTILVQYSDAETETVEAKRRVIEFMQGEADAMRRDIPALKKTISAEEEYQVPTSIYMADAMTEEWTKKLGRIPGDFGAKSLAAMALLGRSADEANMITTRKWVEDCIADLDKCEATLAELDTMLAAMRAEL
jgi:hypothetical protein